MAEEDVHYASEVGTNKRKYEEEQTISRKPTGFSAPISSQSPDASYNTVPPPMDDFQLAKQKAQEIAARLLNTAEPKKARVDNGSGFDSVEHKPFVNPAVTNSYGYPGPSKKIEVPNARVGVIIGRGGETIKYLQLQSGAKIQVTRDMDSDPHSRTRGVELVGTPEQIAKAEQLISDVLSEADAGGSGIVSRRITGQVAGAEQFVMKVANNKVGLIIGKGGETIKNMQARTGARIQVIPLHLPPGDTSTERTVQIDGSTEQIEAAKQLVYEVTSEDEDGKAGVCTTQPVRIVLEIQEWLEDILNKVIKLNLLQAGLLLVRRCNNLVMVTFNLEHIQVHLPNITRLNHPTLVTLHNRPLVDMPLVGIRQLHQINKRLRQVVQVVMITIVSRHPHNSNKHLEVQLLQLILLPTVTISLQPQVTTRDRATPKMATADIMHLLLTLVIRVLVMISNKVIALLQAMVMYRTQLLMATTLHMVHKVMAVKHLHQLSHQPWANKAISLASSPALLLVTHLKALLKLGMGCHLLPKVCMAPSQQQVMGPLKPKSLRLVIQLMVSLNNLLVHKVAMPNLHRCSPGIHRQQLLNQVMVRVILGLSDLHPLMALQQLTLGMGLLAMDSSHHLTVVPMLAVMCSLRQRTLLMAMVLQIRHPSLFNLVLGGFQKPHLRVNGCYLEGLSDS